MKVSEEDNKTIKKNSSNLNITTSPTNIYNKLYDFLTKNKKREYLDSEEQIEIEKKNRLFWNLCKYFELDSSGKIAHYSLKGYGSDKKLAKDEAFELLKLAAKKGYNQAIEFCENKDIEYPISEENYLKKF
ncbi:hypothetical protein F8M41_013637 [Gigaspora margarita]|uniref:Uncharacterized protein n=1 Tax=Gigaspora margarita TaxID=4874 RepID=A0A8H3ZYQ2_GIGMA|nr:hypothetical protein F8M41_013637 [Gigaspora margarita]